MTEPRPSTPFRDSEPASPPLPEDDHFHEKVPPTWPRRRNPFAKPSAPSRLVILLGIVMVAGIGFLWFLSTNRKADSPSADMLATRLERLESRMNIVGNWQQQMDYLERELNSIQVDPLVARLDRLEENMASRLNGFTEELKRMREKLDKVEAAQVRTEAARPAAPPKPSAPAPAPAARPKYHEVQPGDTLFGISRQYKLSVQELLKLNDLPKDVLIQPGQRLLVGP